MTMAMMTVTLGTPVYTFKLLLWEKVTSRRSMSKVCARASRPKILGKLGPDLLSKFRQFRTIKQVLVALMAWIKDLDGKHES